MAKTAGTTQPFTPLALDGAGKGQCVLMFSGGRDSTLAAIRLAGNNGLTLITVSSDHLFGITNVRDRLRELASILPPTTQWIRISQPEALLTDTSFYSRTCLPCHHAYVVVGVAAAKKLQARSLAFGYTRYQSEWPEQTPLATRALKEVLERHKIELLLPVYDLISRAEAAAQLQQQGLNPSALEQKCELQVKNIALAYDKLTEQVQLWEGAIDCSLKALDEIQISILEKATLGSLLHSDG